MVILEAPFAFGMLIGWLEETGHPVLGNAYARSLVEAGHRLSLVDEDEAIRRINGGERVYTSSETPLAWIIENTSNETLNRAIEICKDKAALRETLKPLDPDFLFLRVRADELGDIDFETLTTPFVLKPTRGFSSFGVYAIHDRADWDAALRDIEGRLQVTNQPYAASVVDIRDFVIEQYIGGTEYAIDLFYDAEGKAHAVNVLRHDFASASDMTDRVYVTNPQIVREMIPFFERWFDQINEVMGARDFCLHAEVRVEGERVRAIEFNPLRFAGVGATDISKHAYGFYTYEAYLNNEIPDFEHAFEGREGKQYLLSFLVPQPDSDPLRPIDLHAVAARFKRVLEVRPYDVVTTGGYGFIFAEVSPEEESEMQALMTADLNEYLMA